MITMAERLKWARNRRFENANIAADALGISRSTYQQYENGIRGFARHAERFANFYRVDLNWLISGKGAPLGKRRNGEVPIHGVVGAGSAILPIEDDSTAVSLGDIQLPEDGAIGAVLIKGNSGYPRFQDGEALVFFTRQLTAADVLNREAIVQTWDGRKLIKTVRRGREKNLFTLESFNAPPEHDVEIMAAWQIYGLLFR